MPIQNNNYDIIIGKDIKTDETSNITTNSTNADIANSSYSFIQGDTILSKASKSLISGNNIIAYQTYNFSLGQNIYNNSQFNLSVGDTINDSGLYSINIGYKVKNTGQKSISVGEKVLNNNLYTFSIGNAITTNSDNSIVSGNSVTSNGQYALINGNNIISDGTYSLVCGSNITTNGSYNIVSGDSNDASGAFIYGSNNKAQESFVFGDNNTDEVDSTGIIGYGNVLKNYGYSYIVGLNNEISLNSDKIEDMNSEGISEKIFNYTDLTDDQKNNFIFGSMNYLGEKNNFEIQDNFIIGNRNILLDSESNYIFGEKNYISNTENSTIIGNYNYPFYSRKYVFGENLNGISYMEIGIQDDMPFIIPPESNDYLNFYAGILVLRATENQELIAPEQTKEKIANNDLFLVTREYVDPPVILKTPDTEQTITIDFSIERYTTSVALTADLTKIHAINVKPGQSGKIFIKQDNVGGREIDLIGGRFVWETNEYEDIQPNPNPNWVTIYNYFVYGELTIVLKKEYEFLYNQQLAVNSSLDQLSVNSNGDTLIV